MKSREHIVTNGRAAFYAIIWEDFRLAALDCGWALGLHGSLASDIDIMAMPWIPDAKPVEELIKALENCLTKINNEFFNTTKSYGPHNRTTYTIPIWSDYYIDINVIEVEYSL